MAEAKACGFESRPGAEIGGWRPEGSFRAEADRGEFAKDWVMSYRVGKAALNLEWTERVARTEYNDSWEIVRHYTGKDPREHPEAEREFNDAVHLDFLWRTNDGPVPWEERGRATDMGHATYLEDGSDRRDATASPFASVDEVLAFNAVEEYGLPDFDELVAYYEDWYQREQAANDQVVPGGYYWTLISGAIAAFGWEMLLLAAGEEPERFGEEVLGSFFDLSLHHVRAWAETSVEFFMCHDDMVWTQGPFIRPDFYRSYVFPRYRELWRPLKEAGKRVLYTSDGTFDMFLDELMAAGADGFCFEPTNDLDELVKKCGKTHALIGGMDCRTLTFGAKEDVERELRRTLEVTRECPGFMLAIGNHLPANIPLENALHYFELVEELGRR